MKSDMPHRALIVSTAFAFLLVGLLAQPGLVAAEDRHAHQAVAVSQAAGQPDWEKKVADQLEREYAAEGRSGHRDQVDAAMQKMMDEIAKGTDRHAGHAAETGPFKGMGMMQQMDRSVFLGASTAETVTPGSPCPSNAPRRVFDISAITIEITLNQWLDYHPGYMYVLTESIQKVRDEEARNKEARANKEFSPGAVSTGLQTDLIQPLVIRGNQGDCVEFTLRNSMESDDVGVHIHGSSVVVKATGQAATAVNPDTNVKPGKSQTFQWYIRPDEQEGGHMFHSHVGRQQSILGMIGVFNLEPKGSLYLDPITGQSAKSGWQMMIVNPEHSIDRKSVV